MKKVNILVVDDRPEGILAVQAVLNSPSYNIITASSGNEALKHLLQDDFAVILLDVQMPIMNGFETASVIKTREKSRDIPIIFMSAINQDEQYVYQGYGVGAVDYLLKPFDPYILRSKVAIFVDMYRKNLLIKEQAKKLFESEVRNHAQAMDRLEIENLRRYQYLADSIPQIVFRLKQDGQYQYFNKVWYEYTGLTNQASTGHAWMEVFHPMDVLSIMNLFKESPAQTGVECECRILNRNGQFRWHLLRIHPEKYGNLDEVSTWLGTATDIEDRKRNEEMQSFLSEAGEVLVSTIDYRMTLQSISKLAIPYLADWCVFDMARDDGNLQTEIIYHHDQNRVPFAKEFYQKFFLNRESEMSAYRVLADGKHLVVNRYDKEKTSALLIPLSLRGRKVGVLTFVSQETNRHYDNHCVEMALELARRITFAIENARLYQISQEAIEIRNDFLSIASHELNTPITSLKLQLQMVRKSLLSNKEGDFPLDKFHRSIEASVKQVDRLINLVQVLLDVSRIQSGKLNFNFEFHSVQDIVREVQERHREIIHNSECELIVHNEVDLQVRWDKTRIEQILTNLLTNAVKYAPGKIELRVEEEGDFIAMSVKDFGKGIPKENLHSIFERFERASSGDNVSGLGLGLYIVKQIAEGHGGHVQVDSSTDGTLFAVRLPKDAAHRRSEPPNLPQEESIH
jgi:PAS domain S-box-containing protein